MNIKHLVSVLVSLAIVGVAIWQDMELLAIISFIAFLSLIYLGISKRIYYILTDLIRNTKQAKFGDFEIMLKDGAVIPINDVSHLPVWSRVLLSQLTSKEVGILAQLSQNEHGSDIIVSMKDVYRDLRAKGLLEHDAKSIANSKRIWLSKTGNELARLLLVNPKSKSSEY